MGVKKRVNKRLLQEFGIRLLSAYEHRLEEAASNDYKLLERTMKHRPDIIDKADRYKVKFRPAIRETEVQDVWDLMKEKKPKLYNDIISDDAVYEWANEELNTIIAYLKN